MSQTIVKTETQIKQVPLEEVKQEEPPPNLVLRLQKPKPIKKVKWAEDVIDNEGMGKLKSNICCQYHRGGSESSSTCSSDNEVNALERSYQTKQAHKKVCSKQKKISKKDPKKHKKCCH